MSAIIEIRNVTKEFRVLNRREGLRGSIKDLFSRDYKTVRAVDNISMSIQQGEIVGYLGPNGAGKSTTIKMMTGVLEPTSGEILIGGKHTLYQPHPQCSGNRRSIRSAQPALVGTAPDRVLPSAEGYLHDR
jgi:ABC-type uncharacterized transport system ATPase subunit